MSYDLAVWEGKRPFLGRGAGRTFARFMDEMEQSDVAERPWPSIDAFVEELLTSWPDLGESGDECSPWAAGPLMQEASGAFIYIAMTYDGAEQAVPVIAKIARKHDLVCYDPQVEQVI